MIDLEEIKLPNTEDSSRNNSTSANEQKPVKSHDVSVHDWFIKGPIDGPWISNVCGLSKDNIAGVALAICHAKGIKGKGNDVILDRYIFNRFGVMKDSARRSLERLEEAGLIEWVKSGKKFVITILSIEPDDKADS